MGERGGGKLWTDKGRGGGCHQVAISPVGRMCLHKQKQRWEGGKDSSPYKKCNTIWAKVKEKCTMIQGE